MDPHPDATRTPILRMLQQMSPRVASTLPTRGRVKRCGARRLSLPHSHLTISNSPSPASPPADHSRAGAAFSPAFAGASSFPPNEGEQSAETARGACEAPLACRAIGTPRRLRGVPRPLAIGDARLSAPHRGDFGPPGPRFRLRHYPPKRVQRCSSRPGPSVRRAVPVPSEPAGASRSRGTPLPAPPSERLRRRPSRARMIRI